MGHDGKTGETLLKSVLAPMFAASEPGGDELGGAQHLRQPGRSGARRPGQQAAKVASKDRLLGEILGYRPQTHVSIEYIESLGDWKTAWDHIHFRGFLGTPMTLQFTWQGCDSLLAAPLVLDLVRFVDLARRRGETGPLGFLASFFKSPLGAAEDDFASQFGELIRWAESQLRNLKTPTPNPSRRRGRGFRISARPRLKGRSDRARWVVADDNRMESAGGFDGDRSIRNRSPESAIGLREGADPN